ncbi:16S rRNA (guanine(527)-N(7))-methyltransferase RsmG [Bacteroidetes/Chlorobi group bacterium ChocPot_Mid]|jgi:16S rRNA (guanine527-N7)-methyltransferase|nr:MAG: 16S rRNA (guanine(527)-N(7))-methyltransferase RsmG [Bacteroidetes/Chlorobi group bacterium ChocPot_Mid]
MTLLEFWTICSSNNIVLDKEQMKMIERYADEIKYWNNNVNLISRQEEDQILEKHILHSLVILKYVDIKHKARCIDIGTGAGLPGIPLKIARNDLEMLLIDSIQKKIKITSMFAKHTGLKKIDAVSIRAEDLANQNKYHNYYDFVFARAVKKILTVLNWVKPLLNKEGLIVFLKGGNLNDEIEEAKKYYPDLSVNEINIKINGYQWFEENEKKIVICSGFRL